MNAVRREPDPGAHYRVEGDLETSDLVMENTMWLGVYPGLSPAMIN